MPDLQLFASGSSTQPSKPLALGLLTTSPVTLRLSLQAAPKLASVIAATPVAQAPATPTLSAVSTPSNVMSPTTRKRSATVTTGTYPLTEDVLSYIQNKSPLLAGINISYLNLCNIYDLIALVCVVHNPTTLLKKGGTHLDLALSLTHGNRVIFQFLKDRYGFLSDSSLSIALTEGGGSGDGTKAPVVPMKRWNPDRSMWHLDDNVSKCMIAGEEFGTFRRRHHCRACGKVVCDNCSRKRIVIPDSDNDLPDRVCDECHPLILLDIAEREQRARAAQQSPRKKPLVSQPSSLVAGATTGTGSVPTSPVKGGGAAQPQISAVLPSMARVAAEHPKVLLVEGPVDPVQQLYARLYEQYEEEGRLVEALRLVDDGKVPSPPPDRLLVALAEKQPKVAAKYLVRIRDKTVKRESPPFISKIIILKYRLR